MRNVKMYPIFVGLLQLVGLSPTSSTAGSLSESMRPLIQYFDDLKLVPVIVPRDQKVGDVYDLNTLQFIHNQKDCFPNLQTKTTPSSLPSLTDVSKESAFISMDIPIVMGTKLSASVAEKATISFSNVFVTYATQDQLHDAFNKQACADLEPTLDGQAKRWFSSDPQFLVIGEIYVGTRIAQLQLEQGVDADVSSAFASGGVPIQVSLGSKADARDQITLQSTRPFPIAVRPAFVPRFVHGQTMGPNSSSNDSQEYVRWDPFDASLPTHAELISKINSTLSSEADRTGSLH
jgi:hypothetical protein